MNKCASVAIYDDIEFCKGETTLPGLRPEVYYIPKTLILTYPTLAKPSDTDATLKTIATYDGNFGLAADAVFFKLDILTDASKIASESQGNPPSKTFLNSCTLKYAGNNEVAAGFSRLINSDDILFVIRQRDGKFRVIGNDSFETDCKPAQDSGMAVTDASGTTIEVSVTDVCPAPFYAGTLKTSAGTINCATGEITVTPGA